MPIRKAIEHEATEAHRASVREYDQRRPPSPEYLPPIYRFEDIVIKGAPTTGWIDAQPERVMHWQRGLVGEQHETMEDVLTRIEELNRANDPWNVGDGWGDAGWEQPEPEVMGDGNGWDDPANAQGWGWNMDDTAAQGNGWDLPPDDKAWEIDAKDDGGWVEAKGNAWGKKHSGWGVPAGEDGWAAAPKVKGWNTPPSGASSKSERVWGKRRRGGNTGKVVRPKGVNSGGGSGNRGDASFVDEFARARAIDHTQKEKMRNFYEVCRFSPPLL